ALRVAGVGFQQREHLRRRAGQVEVVHEVQLADASVGGAVAPVVDHVVADIQPPGEPLSGAVQPAGQAPVPPCAVGEQIVVEAADVAGDAPGERVPLAGADVLLVAREIERLRDDAPLEGEVAALAGTEPLVDAPTNRAVVENDVVATARPAAVLRYT